MTYSHALLLAARCTRGCGRSPVCLDEDDLLICAVCARSED